MVNRGQESRQKDNALGVRDLNAVEGLKAALKLSEVRTGRTPSSALYGDRHRQLTAELTG